MTDLPHLNPDDFPEWSKKLRQPFQNQYHAMYSSIFGGIVTDPRLMVVPVDDHMVHRGDAVFETLKFVNGNIYALNAHLDRLCSSAKGLSLGLPCQRVELADIIVQTARASGKREGLIRVLLSRGPGSLGVNPYDCPTPALYVVVSEFKKPFMELHPDGARVRASSMPVKPSPFSNIKSVNYLFNALMKKEAVDAGVDFVVSFDERRHLAEAPTENAGIVTKVGVLQVPRPERILAGTTMNRVIELARQLVEVGQLARSESADITREHILDAAEMLIFGTTPDVTAVVEFDGKPVGKGKPGPIARALNRLLLDDIHDNKAMQTPID
jgi:branched-subunit amino acid aminotransferase/4-amino-4-deoxychorismate lyase